MRPCRNSKRCKTINFCHHNSLLFPIFKCKLTEEGIMAAWVEGLRLQLTPHSILSLPKKNDQDTTQNGARRQYQRVIAFQSHWREPPYHGNSHDAPSSSDASETNNQRGITEEKA
mmetsp:Transcript_3408/g.7210  ORF Transcript_3408/g.7210 Transcript_3408/m.7210 type:complete len:115 (+) Transcript_3408:615-959(+)